MLLIVIGLAFLMGLLLVLGLAGIPLNAERAALARRLESLANPTELAPSLADAQFEGGLTERLWQPIRLKLARLGTRLTPQGVRDHLRHALAQAGRPAGLGSGEFAGLRLVSGMLFSVLALAGCVLIPTPLLRVLLVGFCLLIGLALPDTLLQQAIRRRHAQVRRALPDMVDLLVVSVEAGLSLDGAFAKVTKKMQGPLAEELSRALDEMRVGQTRGQALKALAARLGMEEIKTFVAAVYQSDQLGTSIARTLRAQSQSLRTARMQRLREQASQLPVTMLFPLVFFIFPAVFVVLIGPSLIRLFEALSRM